MEFVDVTSCEVSIPHRKARNFHQKCVCQIVPEVSIPHRKARNVATLISNEVIIAVSIPHRKARNNFGGK